MILLTDGATLVEYWDGVRLIPPVESEDAGSWSVKPEEIAAEQAKRACSTIIAVTERALDAARACGRQAGWLKCYEQLPSHLIEEAVRSLDKQIERHRQWVANPQTKLPRSYPAEGVWALVSRKWPMDIARLKEQRGILMVPLQEIASHEEKQR